MVRVGRALAALAVIGCAFPGDPGQPLEPASELTEPIASEPIATEPIAPYAERVEIHEVDAFALRIERFYRSIARRPLDAYATFQDPGLRSFFDDPKQFEEYYAALANQVREANFRHGRAERIQVREFRFEGDAIARVDVAIIGRHERAFRFWELVIERTDTWGRAGDTWFLRPGRL